MSYIKPLISLEVKNRNLIVYAISFYIIYIAISFIITSGKQAVHVKLIKESIISYVFMGLTMSIAFIENIKNDQNINLIKTYITYPFSALQYIISKLYIYIILDMIILIGGTITFILISGYINIAIFQFLLINALYTIFSITAIILISVILSRFNIVSEIFAVFFYLFIFLVAFSSIEISPLFSLFPFLPYFHSLLHFTTGNYNHNSLLTMPIILIFFILFSLIILKRFKWEVFYDLK